MGAVYCNRRRNGRDITNIFTKCAVEIDHKTKIKNTKMAENKRLISYTNLFQNSINSINVSASEYLLLKEGLSY
jgi:hypothetical protein